MPRVAVVAHADKSFGGGLGELKAALTREGFADPLWYEVKKSRKAAKCARRALARCAEVIFIWGGATGRSSAASMPWPGPAPSLRSFQPAQRICWRPTWKSRPTSPRRCGSACTGIVASLVNATLAGRAGLQVHRACRKGRATGDGHCREYRGPDCEHGFAWGRCR